MVEAFFTEGCRHKQKAESTNKLMNTPRSERSKETYEGADFRRYSIFN